MDYYLKLGLLMLTILAPSCAFKVELTSQKTALENQILGDYQEIDDEIILISTVRGEEEGKIEKILPVELARQNQRFNLDDIEELKRDQILGETRQGKLVVLPGELISSNIKKSSEFPFKIKLARAILQEENSDRRVVWLQTVADNKNLTKQDLIEVQKAYALQIAKDMSPGYWHQSDSGKWVQKTAEQSLEK